MTDTTMTLQANSFYGLPGTQTPYEISHPNGSSAYTSPWGGGAFSGADPFAPCGPFPGGHMTTYHPVAGACGTPASDVPEPSAAVLLGTALILAALVRRVAFR